MNSKEIPPLVMPMTEMMMTRNKGNAITVTTNAPLSRKKKDMIKGLAFLQLICMTPDEQEDENFEVFMQIVGDAAADVRELYNENNDESSSIEQF